MIVIIAMGCTVSSSVGHDPTNTQTELHPIIKTSHGHAHHSANDKPVRKVTSANKLTATNGRVSPAYSDKTDTNKSVKRVAFTDDPHLETSSQATVTRIGLSEGSIVSVSSSPSELKRARQKRERNLRKRLLNKMGEAESLSERLLLESERLSLTSSMSRTTSRTGSPFHFRSDFEKGEDSITEVSTSDLNTPRQQEKTTPDKQTVET